MPMLRYGRRSSILSTWGLDSGTPWQRIEGVHTNRELPVVVNLHGRPGVVENQKNHIDATVRSSIGYRPGGVFGGPSFPFDALLSTGHVIYTPWCGREWGQLGPPGTVSIDHALANAEYEGFNHEEIILVGGSMGACNAINWAYNNPTKVFKILLGVPLVDLVALWDIGAFNDELADSFGVPEGDRSAFIVASESVDPARMDLSNIAHKVMVIAATNDPLITYSAVMAWCTNWEIPLTTITTGHWSFDDPAVDEIVLLNHLTRRPIE